MKTWFNPSGAADATARRPPFFFFGMAVILAIIVAGGFAKSFYLVPFESPAPDVQPFPLYLQLHGLLLTLWFLLLIVQTGLVATRRVRLHRSLGVAGVVLAAAVWIASFLVVVRSVARSGPNGVPPDRLPLVVIGNLGTLLLFALFVTAGIRLRGKPDLHRRLMLLASISIVGPAISRWPGALAFFPVTVLLLHLSLFGALVIYDLRSARRIQWITGLGVGLYVAVLAASVALGLSSFGRALVERLR